MSEEQPQISEKPLKVAAPPVKVVVPTTALPKKARKGADLPGGVYRVPMRELVGIAPRSPKETMLLGVLVAMSAGILGWAIVNQWGAKAVEDELVSRMQHDAEQAEVAKELDAAEKDRTLSMENLLRAGRTSQPSGSSAPSSVQSMVPRVFQQAAQPAAQPVHQPIVAPRPPIVTRP